MGSRLSFVGLGSGIDFQSIIDTVVKFESRRIDLVKNRQAEETQRLTALRSLDALLVKLKAQAGTLADPGDFDVQKATSSNPEAVTASVSGNAPLSTQTITVNALAQAAQVASQGIAALDTDIGTGTVQVTVGSKITTVTLDSTNNTLEGLRDAINKASTGVTATIINDGSQTNPFRLLLTGSETGAANQISVDVNLAGGQQVPDFTTKRIDAAEAGLANNAAYTGVAQSGGAYTGTENKTFLVEVLSGGAVGAATFRYSTDGGFTFNDNGGAGFTTSTTPVALADGVTVSFTDSGTLTAGDQFEIDVFNPQIQRAQDASVTLGSTAGGGSPITISSATNTITNLIQGVTLTLNEVTAGPVRISVGADTESVRSAIDAFVKNTNDVLTFLDQQLDFDPETETGGVLLGESVPVTVQNRLRRILSNTVPGLPSNLNRLSAIGIKTNIDTGKLEVDSAVLDKALAENLDAVAAIFSTSLGSDRNGVSVLSTTDRTVPSGAGYAVDITRAATQGRLAGTALGAFPRSLDATNNELVVVVDGQQSGVIRLDERAYTSAEDLALEVQNKINADPTLGGRDVTVTVDAGALVIASKTFGSNSEVRLGPATANSAFSVLGLTGGTSVLGVDVAGTINGEAATGTGQVLKGNAGNTTTDGLSLLITLTEAQLNPSGPEANVTITEGVGKQLRDELSRLTDPVDGRLTRREQTSTRVIDDLDAQVARQEARLEERRQSLIDQFARLEASLTQINSQGELLTQQLANLPRIDTLTRRGGNNNRN